MASDNFDSTLELVNVKATEYLKGALKDGRIDQQLYKEAKKNILPNLEHWLKDPYIDKHRPRLREGICSAINMKSDKRNKEEAEKEKKKKW